LLTLFIENLMYTCCFFVRSVSHNARHQKRDVQIDSITYLRDILYSGCQDMVVPVSNVGPAVSQAVSGPGSSRFLVMLDPWWRERHWSGFPLPLIHSTNCSTIIAIHHPRLLNRPLNGRSISGLDSTAAP
jgi:hypothetical protein